MFFSIGIVTFIIFNFIFNPILAYIIALLMVFTVSIVLAVLKLNKRNNILEKECNPVKYIKIYKKCKENINKIKSIDWCNLNIAVGFLHLREYQKALNYLKNVSFPMKQNQSFQLSYHLALMICYIGLSDLEKAEFEYENYIQKSRGKLTVNNINFAIDSVAMEYNYLLQKSSETAKYYLDMLYYRQKAYNKIINKCQNLNLLYRIATLEQELGNIESAIEKYKIISENGNLLWIATESKNKLNELCIK